MDVDNHQRGVLHLAVEGDFSSVLNVLLENGADPDLMDEEGNTGEHTVYTSYLIYCVCVHVYVCSWILSLSLPCLSGLINALPSVTCVI